MTADDRDAEHSYRLEAIAVRIAQSVRGEAFVRFSAYPLDDDELPVDNLDEIAFSGRCKFVQPAGLWSDKAYESIVQINPTWLDVARLANDMIQITGNDHHVYLEGIGRVSSESDVTVLGFEMGS